MRTRVPLDITYLKMAFMLADDRSIDPFTQAGCIAANANKKMIGGSYNGFPEGYEPDFDISLPENRDKKNELIIHAEENILLRNPMGSIYTIYLTCSPCKNCAKLIATHGVKRVVYGAEYHRETIYKDIFTRYGVKFELLTLPGQPLLQTPLNP